MDDVNINELSDSTPIFFYKKFFGKKIYNFNHPKNESFKVVFKVKDITLCYGGGYRYRVWCEILSLQCNGGDKINTLEMRFLQLYFKVETKCDLNLCSIDDIDVVIYNRTQFEIVEKKSSHIIKGGYEFYNKSVSKYSSYSTEKDLIRSTKFNIF